MEATFQMDEPRRRSVKGTKNGRTVASWEKLWKKMMKNGTTEAVQL